MTLTPDVVADADTYPMAPGVLFTYSMISASDAFSGGAEATPEKIACCQ
jgi:hypothetical protein